MSRNKLHLEFKKQSGLTLLEVVVVLALLGLIMAALFNILNQLIWLPAQRTDELNLLHNVRQAARWFAYDARQATDFAAGSEPNYGTFSWVDRSDSPLTTYSIRYYYSAADVRLMREETINGSSPQALVVCANIQNYSDISLQETGGLVLATINATMDSTRDTISRTATLRAQMRTVLPTTPPTPPAYTLARDDFESVGWAGGIGWLGDWYYSGDASIVSTGSPYEGTYHLRLRQATGYVDRAADLTGETNVRLQFWAKANSFEAGETATCSVSPDGVNWYTVRTWVDGNDDNVYHFEDIDLSSYSMTSEFWIAFDAQMADAGDYLWVDDLKVVRTW